ncbi:hypothetical protein EDB80DRAFT_829680 [Ilyonectria destructans]|nr:hypothetical protein EDB80DRAFT_829680 [Ilyonectria destructans]
MLGADGVSTIVQASNNYFANCKGHAFDVYPGTTALLEGNLFEAVTTPITAGSEKVSSVYPVPDSGSISACASSLGRSCVANSLSGSGKWPSLKSTSPLSTLKGVRGSLVAPIQAASVTTTVYAKLEWAESSANISVTHYFFLSKSLAAARLGILSSA